MLKNVLDFIGGNLGLKGRYKSVQEQSDAVGRQPFGGLKMSGIGSKSGGPDYLLQFLKPRVVTENTIRRGFAPGEGK